MIRLNETANGKRRFFRVGVLREWDIITCDEDPRGAISEMFRDGHLDDGGFRPDCTTLIKIKEVKCKRRK